jgi:hypothetical protein
MQKKIATLEVFVNTNPEAISYTRRTGKVEFKIQLSPDVQGRREAGLPPDDSIEGFRTVLAHELGHFVALLTKDETHNPVNQLMFRLTGDPTPLRQAEKKAWAIAHEIYPNLDREDERSALASYGTTPDTSTWKMFQ